MTDTRPPDLHDPRDPRDPRELPTDTPSASAASPAGPAASADSTPETAPDAAPKTAPEATPGNTSDAAQTDSAPPTDAAPLLAPKPGPAARTFALFATLGLCIPLLVVFAQTCLGLDARDLWFSDEVRHGAAYQAMVQSGDWLILTLNSLPYPDKPPLYFWFLRLLDTMPALDPPMLFLAAAALCGLLFTGSTWLLARALGYDKPTSLAACLVLLCTFSFLGITHYARMDLLFATCIILSQACLFRGWIKESAPIWLAGGFVLAALACLIKGPLGLAFPLLTSIIFLIWRGTFRRAGGRDGAFGFALMLIILLAWVFAVMLQPEGTTYLRSMFGRHVIDRAVDAWHHKQPWWFYFANMPLGWLPWTPLLLFLPWGRMPRLLKGLVTARTKAPGHGWVWISVISGFALLSLLSGKVAIYTLPLYPLLAILTAQGLLTLSPRSSRGFFLFTAALIGLLGISFGLVGLAQYGRDYLASALPLMSGLVSGIVSPEVLMQLTDSGSPASAYFDIIQGAPHLAIICLVGAWLLGRRTDRSNPGGALLVLTLVFVALAQPLALVTAPSLNRLMSPGPQAAVLRDYADKGYHVTAFSVTTGTYSYHMGGTMDEVNDWDELARRLAEYPDIIVATRLNRWKEWQERPELDPQSFTVLDTQWIAERRYVILVRHTAPTPPTAPTEQQPPATATPTPPETTQPVPPPSASTSPEGEQPEIQPEIRQDAPSPDTAPEPAPVPVPVPDRTPHNEVMRL